MNETQAIEVTDLIGHLIGALVAYYNNPTESNWMNVKGRKAELIVELMK